MKRGIADANVEYELSSTANGSIIIDILFPAREYASMFDGIDAFKAFNQLVFDGLSCIYLESISYRENCIACKFRSLFFNAKTAGSNAFCNEMSEIVEKIVGMLHEMKVKHDLESIAKQ